MGSYLLRQYAKERTGQTERSQKGTRKKKTKGNLQVSTKNIEITILYDA